MRAELSEKELAGYLIRQIGAIFPDGEEIALSAVVQTVTATLQRLEESFRVIRDARFQRDGAPFLDYLHSDQYAMFLSVFSHLAWKEFGLQKLATKTYLLNKVLHNVDVFYEVEMPRIFHFAHPVGTVLGRARYNDYLVVLQNCTVGNIDGHYPTLGVGTVLCTNATVLGKTELGDNVCVGAGTLLVNEKIESNSTVTGRPGSLKIRPAEIPAWKNNFTG